MKKTTAVSLVAGFVIMFFLATTACKKKDGSTAAIPGVGVPECDECIAKYEKCLDSKVSDAAQRKQMKTSFARIAEQWRKVASTPNGKSLLTTSCKAGFEDMKKAMAAYGCEW